MKSQIPIFFLLAPLLSSAFIVPAPNQLGTFADGHAGSLAEDNEKRLIQLSPTDIRWVTEADKLALKRDGKNFMDITDHQELGQLRTTSRKQVVYPDSMQFKDKITPLLKNLKKENMHENLEKFTSFHTRYYKSDHGRQSSEWLLSRINATANGYPHLELSHFPHRWAQSSIIARIPGKSERTVVIGAHQDSINLFFPSLLAAPGADDDGSGTVTILEAFRVLIEYLQETNAQLEQTLEFHWYSAEEGGLLGSQAIFHHYEKTGRDVVAMLQQDMTGFVQKTLDAGKPESVGVITDYVDPGLTDFVKKVIVEYCDIPYVETQCGYACSDHASASKGGYPSAFVIESSFEDSDDHIHTTEDLIKYLSFDHMIQHGKMTLALALELSKTKHWNEKQGDDNGGGEL